MGGAPAGDHRLVTPAGRARGEHLARVENVGRSRPAIGARAPAVTGTRTPLGTVVEALGQIIRRISGTPACNHLRLHVSFNAFHRGRGAAAPRQIVQPAPESSRWLSSAERRDAATPTGSLQCRARRIDIAVLLHAGRALQRPVSRRSPTSDARDADGLTATRSIRQAEPLGHAEPLVHPHAPPPEATTAGLTPPASPAHLTHNDVTHPQEVFPVTPFARGTWTPYWATLR